MPCQAFAYFMHLRHLRISAKFTSCMCAYTIYNLLFSLQSPFEEYDIKPSEPWEWRKILQYHFIPAYPNNAKFVVSTSLSHEDVICFVLSDSALHHTICFWRGAAVLATICQWMYPARADVASQQLVCLHAAGV